MGTINKKLHAALTAMLAEQKGARVNGKTARTQTDVKHREVVYAAYSRLVELGYRIENPRNISEKHLDVLVKSWYKSGLGNKTIQNYRSRLSIFFQRIGKSANFFKPLTHYLPHVEPKSLKVITTAQSSKSWTELGINVIEKIKEADKVDPSGRFGLILRVMLSFGLRKVEALSCFPWKSTANNNGWYVYPSEAKSARPRIIPIQTFEQAAVMEYVKKRINKTDRLRWHTRRNGKSGGLEWAETRFNYYMRQIGLTREQLGGTGHGLRNAYAENSAVIAGFVAPTLGGTGTEKSKDEMKIVRMALSELMGHSRLEIMNAYFGTFNRNAIELTHAQYMNAMKAGVAEMEQLGLIQSRPLGLKADCQTILDALETIEAELTHSQVFALWTQYSERHAVAWVKPQSVESIIAAMYIAATKHLRQRDAEKHVLKLG